MTKIVLSFLLFFLLFSVFPVQASTSVSLPVIYDTYVDQSRPDASYGSTDKIINGHTTSSNAMEAFLKFDLSGIPLKSEIESATLYLHIYDGSECLLASEYPYINSVNASWTENLTWNSKQMSYGGTNSYLNINCSTGYIGSDMRYSVQQMVDGVVVNHGFLSGQV